jgi:hypothetical protein
MKKRCPYCGKEIEISLVGGEEMYKLSKVKEAK